MVQRRKFSKEFKLEAVNLVIARGVSLAQVSRDLDVGENVLGRWVREFRQSEQQAFPGHGVQKPDDAEVTRLRREVGQLKMERDILKKPQPSLPRSRREVRLHRKRPEGSGRSVCCVRRSVSLEAGFMPGSLGPRANGRSLMK